MNGSIRKMMRVTCGMLLMVMSGVSQSAELTLESHGSRGGQLRDGEKLATGGLSAGRRTRVFMYG